MVLYRGRRYRLGDRRALEQLEPFRRARLRAARRRTCCSAAEGARSGDLVLYGAFAEAGDIAFDFEFGSHGGVGARRARSVHAPPGARRHAGRVRDGGAVARRGVLSLLRARYRSPATTSARPKTRPEMRLRVVTWNVHGCVGTDGRFDPTRTADALRALAPDVALLQEVGDNRGVHPPIDQATDAGAARSACTAPSASPCRASRTATATPR